ncbi:hypothetical protein LXA43DRAFT_423349 [Ganoderma leucocontextum]|nr:hypothetical protein LXA43DRAFT_423349 [Ganoderma leucocontextum]
MGVRTSSVYGTWGSSATHLSPQRRRGAVLSSSTIRPSFSPRYQPSRSRHSLRSQDRAQCMSFAALSLHRLTKTKVRHRASCLAHCRVPEHFNHNEAPVASVRMNRICLSGSISLPTRSWRSRTCPSSSSRLPEDSRPPPRLSSPSRHAPHTNVVLLSAFPLCSGPSPHATDGRWFRAGPRGSEVSESLRASRHVTVEKKETYWPVATARLTKGTLENGEDEYFNILRNTRIRNVRSHSAMLSAGRNKRVAMFSSRSVVAPATEAATRLASEARVICLKINTFYCIWGWIGTVSVASQAGFCRTAVPSSV